MSGLQLILYLLLTALTLAYFYFTRNFSHWKDKRVKYIKPYPLVGSMGSVLTLREHMSQFFLRVYRKYRCELYVGFFQGGKPALMIRDTELIKNILIKDFQHFSDHGIKIDENADPLQAKNLFNLEGQRWKDMRAKLTPTFTSGRMKAMFPLVLECSQNLEKHLNTLAGSGQDLDIKDLLARYTTDVIASCAFGIRCDAINEPDCQFRAMGRKLLETDFIQGLKTVLITFAPEVAKMLQICFLRKELTTFFRTVVRDVMALRKRTGETRKDFMQLLIQLKEEGRLTPEEDAEEVVENTLENDMKLTEDDVTAQALVFFIAGFETSSSALTFALYELSRRPELQTRARQEMEAVLKQHDGQITYQALQELKFLDLILQESLRMYPPVAMLMRTCTKNYEIPGTQLTVEEGTQVFIPIHAMQNDPSHFPHPDTFDPERFSDESENKRRQFMYMPFGEGPRHCIGMRFAKMQSKLGLLSVLRRFEVRPPHAQVKKPLDWDPRQFLLVPKENVLLQIVKAS